MNLPKAIEILTDILVNGTEPGYPIEENALKLGIEALKRINLVREEGDLVGPGLLPGETKE